MTALTGTNRAVVRFYNGRGTAEQWIKEGKAATRWTRLSCHRFRANEVRLLLGVAYNLDNLLRRLALPLAIQKRGPLAGASLRRASSVGKPVELAQSTAPVARKRSLSPSTNGQIAVVRRHVVRSAAREAS